MLARSSSTAHTHPPVWISISRQNWPGGRLEKTGAVVAPTTNYGYKSLLRSGGGPHFAGTVSLRGSTVIAMVHDIFADFIRHGWRRILVIDWHLENIAFVYEGIDEAIREAGPIDGLKVVKVDNLVDPIFRIDPGIVDFVFGGDYQGMAVEHASAWKTSLMLAARPDLVQMDKAVDGSLPQPFAYDVLPVPRGCSAGKRCVLEGYHGHGRKRRAFVGCPGPGDVGDRREGIR